MRRLAALAAVALTACGTSDDTAAPPATTTTEWAQLGPATHIEREPDPTDGLDEALDQATTTTAARARTVPQRANRGAPRTAPPAAAAPRASGGVRIVISTAYCLTGTMANGRPVHQGAVAMNGVPLGSQFEIVDGPRAGNVVTVEDRIGHGSQFDIWMPSCDAARSYGRRPIHIRGVA